MVYPSDVGQAVFVVDTIGTAAALDVGQVRANKLVRLSVGFLNVQMLTAELCYITTKGEEHAISYNSEARVRHFSEEAIIVGKTW